MGGSMIKNLIILSLIAVIVLDLSPGEFLDYVSMGLDKIQQIVYNVKSEVN
jgi:hypothetical protein